MQRKKIWIALAGSILSAVFLAAVVACSLFIKTELNNRYTLRVTLSGMRELTLEHGMPYNEPGAVGNFSGTHRHTEETAVPVTISGKVDTQTLGVYLLKYTASFDGYTGTAYRKVHIVDTQAPRITLVSDPEKFTFPNETYVEEGFAAIDGHDGDLTEKVQRTQTPEKVIYTVTDSSGNVATVERKIRYDDPIAPELKLKGASKITLKVGQKYKEPGYTATDNCDGDLSGSVMIQGSVNTAKAGSYTLVYTVKDAYNNTASVSRTVNVKGSVSSLQQQLNTVTPNGKVIYLTFDDGPGKHTPELLDVLRKYDVKATFFVVNSKYVDTIKRIAQEGHSIGIHTATHNYKTIYANEDAYFKDLNTMRDIITNLTGKQTTLLRFPGGSSNTVSSFNPGIMTTLTEKVKEMGFRYFDWNVDSKDAGGAKTANQVFRNVTKGISGKQVSVVLQHDIKGFSVDAVERIIVWGLENGYTFLPLDETSPVCEHKVKN